MELFVARENVRRFEELLRSADTEKDRREISALLAEAKVKLAKLEEDRARKPAGPA